ncbi:hypothetical protein HY797_03785 [Candidatus Falkowbacteria bacterium]|nr:hypothetical protein [Candidatus Falkowbacteria bacterium]
MIDGVSSDPFSARGRAPLTEEEKTGNKDKVIKVSRERYAKQRLAVEEKINRWHSNNEDAEEKIEKRPGQRELKEAPSRQFTAPKEALKFFSSPASNRNIAVSPKPENPKQAEPDKYNYICSRCSKPTRVSFVPDGIRPIFCKDCLSLAKQEKKQEIENRLEAKKRELGAISAKFTPAAKENFTEAKAAPAISLSRAIKSGPVNFHGKKIEARRDNFKTTNSEKANQAEAVIKEDEEITLRHE